MKELRILRRIFRRTAFFRILLIFLLFALFCALFTWVREPSVTTFGDAVWYVYAVVTTVGFGDVVANTMSVRALSILLSVCSHVLLALLTGMLVSFINELMALRNEESLTALLSRLERLPELSGEELEALSNRLKQFEKKRSER